MKKESVVAFLKEMIIYLIIIVILLFITNKLGWTNVPIIETSIGITIGWIIWKLIMLWIDKKTK